MAIVFHCPECQKQVQVRDDLAGKKVRCPHCKNVVSPPMPSAPQEEPIVATAVDDEEYRSDRPARPRRRTEELRRSRDRDDYDDHDIARSMPSSVMLAVVAMCILLSLELIIGVLSFSVAVFNRDQLARVLGQMGGTVVVGGLILWGLIVGHRLAWQWGRVLAMLGGVMMILLAIVMFAVSSDEFPPVVRFAMGGVAFVFSACLLTITISLGTVPAKEYFNLRCPSCGRLTSAAADFFFNTAKCKRCGNKW